MSLRRARIALVLAVCASALNADPLRAQVWTNWTAFTAGNPGTATGVITGFGSPITVTYKGYLNGDSQIGNPGDIDYWTGTSYTTPDNVNHRPTGTDILKMTGPTIGYRNTLEFSAPITNLYMAILSLGQPSFPVRYTFDQSFTILKQGGGYWGGGSLTADATGTVLTGYEGHGLLVFNAPVTKLTWTTDPAEYWHGFQVGTDGPVTVTPEPASLALMATGLLGLAPLGLKRIRRRKD